jgi:uncharacterized protein
MLSYNVADLLRSAPGTSERHEVAEPVMPIADGVELTDPITGHIRLTNTGRGILAQGRLETALLEQCSRCLRPARAPISVDLEEEARPAVDLESGKPLDVDDEPDVLRLSDHHELDLGPAVRDAISLAEPIAPLCRPDCPGLCETCGLDLTDHPEHAHPGDDVDPRLAMLARLRDQMQESK